jgi:MFS family permease
MGPTLKRQFVARSVTGSKAFASYGSDNDQSCRPTEPASAVLSMIGSGRAPCDDGVIRAAASTGGCAERAKPGVLAATILGSSMAFIDGSVVNVALPAIQADLATSMRGAQWVVNAYMLMLGALIMIGGSAGDRFGRRRVFALGVGIFAAGSVACGLAPNTSALIAMRAVQGVGGALLVPSGLAIISTAFPAGERGRAIGTWAGFSTLTALGPVLGGWLVDSLSWRAIFFISDLPVPGLTIMSFPLLAGRELIVGQWLTQRHQRPTP